jgi:hypothetical protein
MTHQIHDDQFRLYTRNNVCHASPRRLGFMLGQAASEALCHLVGCLACHKLASSDPVALPKDAVERRLGNEPEQEQVDEYLNDSPDHQRACLELLGSQ